MDDIQLLQMQVRKSFEVFGRTPLKERLADILEQAIDLSRNKDLRDMKEATGDLLATVIQLCNENGWDVGDVVDLNSDKIVSREDQYASLGRRINVAILGGSFNPIHVGHIQNAQTILNASKFIDEVWLIPCNQSLYGKKLVEAAHRIEMCKIAAKKDGRIKVCDWEIRNNASGETHHLLKAFLEDPEYKNYKFHFAVGLDNAYKCPNWVNWEYVEQALPFIVVPRKGEKRVEGIQWFHQPPHVIIEDEGTIMEMSSSHVREVLSETLFPKSIDGMDSAVLDYIIANRLYR